MNIHYLQHVPFEGLGSIADWTTMQGHQITVTRLYYDESCPLVHEVDYLLTWNCKHIANAHILKKIESVCAQAGYTIPVICTPEELMEGEL